MIRNHPIGGPVFSGPQVQPWVCRNRSERPKCQASTTYEYEYKSSVDGQLHPYDPDHPPADVARTTTQTGKAVPFIIRIETGYHDRDQYKIAELYQPGEPWQPWNPQPQFNHKLLITHGASCGIRARLERQERHFPKNNVIWFGQTPLIGDPRYTTEGLLAMDRWLSAIERDHRDLPCPRRWRKTGRTPSVTAARRSQASKGSRFRASARCAGSTRCRRDSARRPLWPARASPPTRTAASSSRFAAAITTQ